MWLLSAVYGRFRFMAREIMFIISSASAQYSDAPRMSPVFSSITAFKSHCAFPRILALGSAAHSSFQTFIVYPCSIACFSVSPILAKGGLRKEQ